MCMIKLSHKQLSWACAQVFWLWTFAIWWPQFGLTNLPPQGSSWEVAGDRKEESWVGIAHTLAIPSRREQAPRGHISALHGFSSLERGSCLLWCVVGPGEWGLVDGRVRDGTVAVSETCVSGSLWCRGALREATGNGMGRAVRPHVWMFSISVSLGKAYFVTMLEKLRN